MKTTKIDRGQILTRYKPMESSAHKGTQGHALIIAGSYGKMGAACLATKAALKSGCGLVTAFIPRCGYEILQISVPEAMVVTDEKRSHLSDIKFSVAPQAIGIGPGIGQEPETKKAFAKFLKTNTSPLVIDADGLNILAANPSQLQWLMSGCILTPHPKELERLLGKWDSEKQKLALAVRFSTEYKVLIVMKGAPTYIVDQDNIYENTTGNAALATGGSGDVLTGIITSLLAQGYDAVSAAILGVYLHGLTADIAAPDISQEAFMASDIINNLGRAFVNIQQPIA
ncbi:MAG: NAD(P)H-hydrate dehydratase [Flavobacterium sp. BFFFF1]|uniref:NAD(P)H-hydrate dehydratase n=1 Tax=Flavobacterium sp. BFFFF1 TaxID=2015557 RepID=UPI000BC6EFB9|nr:NAD(P)H-hydrate dehydratase [Flavobacterium sp. BFFFF1]OYU80093.1 MAG: NAD(P)H-hydrate dehydratase [Flavobacterium sp. BFFFF1]